MNFASVGFNESINTSLLFFRLKVAEVESKVSETGDQARVYAYYGMA